MSLPRKRITINLAPADVPKVSTGFDPGVTTAILAAGNLDPAVLAPGVQLVPVSTLTELSTYHGEPNMQA